MDFGAKLAEGKTKIVYAHPDEPSLAIIQHKDGITSGDGVRRNVIVGKGALSGRTTANVFRVLGRVGVKTHFVAAPTPDVMVVRRCTMIPLEVVTRRMAAGSYLKRFPEVAEGTRFEPLLVEFFLKDDARHDPQISEAEIVSQRLASTVEVEQMISTAHHVFLALESIWASQQVTLVDLKIEFGRDVNGVLLVADVIDNDSWRIWPGGDKQQMLDKQVYRNMREVTEAGLAEVQRRYMVVADLTDAWVA